MMQIMIWRWLKFVHRLRQSKTLVRTPAVRDADSVQGQPGFKPIGVVPLDLSQPITSGLSENAVAAIGKLLIFKTYYGHGWIGTTNLYHPPEPFVARLLRFFYWRKNRRGGVARVEQSGHPCDGMWAMFATRHIGIFDFDTQIEHYNVAILKTAPDDPADNGTFWVLTEKLPGLVMAGFAEIMTASEGDEDRRFSIGG